MPDQRTPQTTLFQAQLTLPGSLARVRAAVHAIEQAGGKVVIIATGTEGVTTVCLYLPPPYRPENFLPGLPFFQM
jgi:hypothetical protein